MNKKIRNILISIILLFVFLWCCIPPIKYNCKYKLNIVGPYGDDQAYHPKVISFDEEWNGYKYWMAYTPYPNGDSSKENPCIVASNNLINWTTPQGLKNPIDEVNDNKEGKIYNSDAHILYNDELNRLECFWRFVDDTTNQVIIYRSYTQDGIHFSDKEISSISYNRKEHDYISPAIIYENDIYKMWYVDHDYVVKYEESNNGKNWSEPETVELKYEKSNLNTWHIDVISTEKGYELLSVAFDVWKNRNDMSLYYSYSNNEKTGWKKCEKILEPTVGTKYWDNKGIYRTCFMYNEGVYIVFYSGTDLNMNHGIGIMYGENIKELSKVNTNFSNETDINELENKIKTKKGRK